MSELKPGLVNNYCIILAAAQEISDYLIARVQSPWMQDLMVALQEISAEDVALFRGEGEKGHCGDALPEETAAVAERPEETAAVAERSSEPVPSDGVSMERTPSDQTASTLAALSWATHLQDHALLVGLAGSLPEAVVQEQVRLYEARGGVVAKASTEPKQILVYPNLLKSRMQAAAAFDKFLKGEGWEGTTRLPRNACPKFLHTLAFTAGGRLPAPCRSLRAWHAQWQKDARLRNPGAKIVEGRHGSAGVLQMWQRRQRERGLQGRPVACAWLRQSLFEWFMTMRYSIDWNAVRGSLRSGGQKKSLARFTRQLMRQKAQQLLQDYCHECLMRGQRATAVQLTARWFSNWEADYGLNMRKANRKYKVPKAVMAERLQIGWLNVARVRALCLACHGYDPEDENWDQSPFHHIESGSQNSNTLAVAGSTVPLIEGHADTRERWTGNFTTFSNKSGS